MSRHRHLNKRAIITDSYQTSHRHPEPCSGYRPTQQYKAQKAALQLFDCLHAIDPLLNRLCSQTCPWCPDPCCLHARVYYDAGDLIFAHLIGLPRPVCHPRPVPHRPCHFLGPGGCRLARLARPWLCTWYLCPVQKAVLAKEEETFRLTLAHAMRRIKQERRTMREAYETARGQSAGRVVAPLPHEPPMP